MAHIHVKRWTGHDLIDDARDEPWANRSVLPLIGMIVGFLLSIALWVVGIALWQAVAGIAS